jgi:hypothetical protein
VPLEGHWQRVNTPLRETTPRERWIVRALVGLLAGAALVGAVVLIATSSGSGSGTGGTGSAAGCVNVDVPSTMGGSAIHACGKNAQTFCRGPLAHSSDLRARALAACREAGYDGAPLAQ